MVKNPVVNYLTCKLGNGNATEDTAMSADYAAPIVQDTTAGFAVKTPATVEPSPTAQNHPTGFRWATAFGNDATADGSRRALWNALSQRRCHANSRIRDPGESSKKQLIQAIGASRISLASGGMCLANVAVVQRNAHRPLQPGRMEPQLVNYNQKVPAVTVEEVQAEAASKGCSHPVSLLDVPLCLLVPDLLGRKACFKKAPAGRNPSRSRWESWPRFINLVVSPLRRLKPAVPAVRLTHQKVTDHLYPVSPLEPGFTEGPYYLGTDTGPLGSARLVPLPPPISPSPHRCLYRHRRPNLPHAPLSGLASCDCISDQAALGNPSQVCAQARVPAPSGSRLPHYATQLPDSLLHAYGTFGILEASLNLSVYATHMTSITEWFLQLDSPDSPTRVNDQINRIHGGSDPPPNEAGNRDHADEVVPPPTVDEMRAGIHAILDPLRATLRIMEAYLYKQIFDNYSRRRGKRGL
ncbi:hypothetical protein NHQ30_008489 [Ciborinia camelliae]|nr:hypothetical protein NHQ30_008489 [Ciborinia camelliae]